MRLKAPSVGAFHIFADAVDPAGVHRIVGKRPFFEQILHVTTVECMIEHRGQLGPDFGSTNES